MIYFGVKSSKCINESHDDFKVIHDRAKVFIRVDYGIHNAARSFELQLKYFLEGSSKLDPRNSNQLKAAKHVITEERPKAEANDIHIAAKHDGKSLMWNAMHLTYVASYLIATADYLYLEGKVSHRLRWGGNWDKDGIINLDQSFIDNPHLELYKP